MKIPPIIQGKVVLKTKAYGNEYQLLWDAAEQSIFFEILMTILIRRESPQSVADAIPRVDTKPVIRRVSKNISTV